MACANAARTGGVYCSMNVNAPRRPVEDEHFTLRPRLLGHHRFLPVPARQIAGKRVHIGALIFSRPMYAPDSTSSRLWCTTPNALRWFGLGSV